MSRIIDPQPNVALKPTIEHSSMSRRKSRLWALYIAGLFGVIFVSHLAAGAAFLLYDQLPRDAQRSWWTGYALNFAAPLLGGVGFGAVFIAAVVRAQRFTATARAHFVRAVSWYAFALWVLGVMQANRDNHGFGLWVQVILWPLMGTLGALLVDVVITFRRRHVEPRPNEELKPSASPKQFGWVIHSQRRGLTPAR